MSKKLYLIACEASADLHGAHLLAEIKKLYPDCSFRGLGGPQMEAEGFELIHDMTTLSALGLGDVIRQYFDYRKIFYKALRDLMSWKPDALIVIDSPAFNLRFAKKLRSVGSTLPIYYYICPQIWAWGHRRIKLVKKVITHLFSILPFEVSFFEKAGIPCDYVGHPLLDHPELSQNKEALRKEKEIPQGIRAIGILSGSRKREVERILPVMLKSAELLVRKMPDCVFYISKSKNVDLTLYEEIASRFRLPIKIFTDDFSEYVAAMDFALVTSGTATLQTALAGTPFFLLYKAGWSTYLFGRLLIKVPYLGLVNLLAEKKVVPEFIQNDARPELIAREAESLLSDLDAYETMKRNFREVREKLGESGASRRAAYAITKAAFPEGTATETQD